MVSFVVKLNNVKLCRILKHNNLLSLKPFLTMSRLYPIVPHNDIMSTCETYMTKLLKKKNEKSRPVTRDRPLSRTSNNPLSRMSNPKSSVVPYVKTEDKTIRLSEDELLHKEVLNNKMAQVEVTVRTVAARNRSRSNSVCTDKREPWGKLLQHRKSNDTVPSYSYDYGLGTIHFLSKELQQKLQISCPG